MTVLEDRVGDLLRSPMVVYYLACATVGYAGVDGVPRARVRLTGSELSRVQADPLRLLMSVFSYVDDWPNNGHAQRNARVLAQHADRFTEAAHLLASAPAAQWWWSTLDRQAQTWIHAPDTPAVPVPFTVDLRPDPLAPSRPWRALMTSTRVGSLAGMWLFNAWDGIRQPPFSVWHIPIRETARIYEIHSADDWQRLVDWYPCRVEGERVPDWHALASDLDGVHLSMAGFLTASHATTLRDWDSECAVWLRPVFGPPVRLPTWTAPVPYFNNPWPPPEWPPATGGRG